MTEGATTRICLTVTEGTLGADLALIEANRAHIDLVELRADFLTPDELSRIASFPARAGLPAILAIRRPSDGGHFTGPESERVALLARSIVGGWAFVDLEEDLVAPALDRAVARAGVRVIRSFHDFTGVPRDLAGRIRRLARTPSELSKAAVLPGTTGELLAVVEACQALSDLEKIVIGMGDWGFATRILAGRLGSYLTYSTAGAAQAAPGHVDPRTLDELYRVRSVSERTRLFCVIGNPVMHSRSPLIHNSGYRAARLDACYFPVQVDGLEAFFALAERLKIEGASVTIPHKVSVLSYLSERDPFVERIGSCNTLVRLPPRGEEAAVGRSGPPKWRGANTDASGFLAPLRRMLSEGGRATDSASTGALVGTRALVVGAGGAARAVVAALVDAGCTVAILNRTLERAERLAREFGCRAGELSADGLERAAFAVAAGRAASLLGGGPPAGERSLRARGEETAPFDLVVQTTSAGMHPNEGEDPLSFYQFHGSEIVYDLIYAPRETRLLGRARASGCRTIGGFAMLLDQAYLQFKLFTGGEFPSDARGALEG